MAPRLLACFGRRGGGATASAPDDEGQQQEAAAAPGPVLVELFASQGCGASPEADAVAARLAQDSGDGDGAAVAVVVLAFHVDYWDYRGWKDPFASSAWTVRQKAYVEALRLDTLFTPQVVLQGRAHCVGTEHDALAQAVRDAPRYPAPAIKVQDLDILLAPHHVVSTNIQDRSTVLKQTVETTVESLINDCAYAGSAINNNSDLPPTAVDDGVSLSL